MQSMEQHDRPRIEYPYTNDDKRQNVLPSISSRLQYPTTTSISHDPSNVRQSPSEPPNYVQPGGHGHAAYDPVHDAYGLSRVAPNTAGSIQANNTSGTYETADRTAMHPSGSTKRYEDMTLAPIQTQLGQPPHATHSPIHAPEMRSFRPPARPQSPRDNFHTFQAPSRPHGEGSSSSALPQGGVYPSHSDNEHTGYTNLPPLSAPAESSSTSGEARSGPKRIVMACHQCRGRKIRCDAGRPACSNCVRRREECRYDVKPKRRGPDKIPGSRMRSCKSRKQTDESS